MFVIVDMPERQKRLFEKFRNHEIELKRYDVAGCAPFFVASCYRGYTDYEELKKIISRYGVALTADEYVGKRLAPVLFNPSVLPLKMLIKTVGEYFYRQKSVCNYTISVIDKSAKGCEALAFLARYVRYVRVVTSRFDRYEKHISKIFSAYGISVELSDNVSTVYGSDVIISLDDRELGDIDFGKIICYRKFTQACNVFTLSKSDLRYEKFDSEYYGVDNYTFICALYETCGYSLTKIPIFDDIGELNRIL